jgi:NADH:ubiquinone oxidoreductase subunit 4 (subunit M)
MLEGLMIGVFCALDAMLFYVFFEAMLIPMFIIIGVWGGPRRVYATMKFFLYTFLGSVFMLVGLIYLYLKSGSFDLADAGPVPADPNRTDVAVLRVPRSRSRSRCRCFPCTPGCRMRMSRRPPAVR